MLRSSGIIGIEIKDDAALEIALRSRGTPRIANRLLRRIRDFAQVKGDGAIDMKITKDSLLALDVDEKGLDDIDRKLLSTIIEIQRQACWRGYSFGSIERGQRDNRGCL